MLSFFSNYPATKATTQPGIESEIRYHSHTYDELVTTFIKNGRVSDPGPWEECGFTLLKHQSNMQDWDNKEELETVHLPEIETLAKTITGCDHALVWTFLHRNQDVAKTQQHLMPVGVAHADFAKSIETQLRSYFDEPQYTNLSPRAKRAVGTLSQGKLDHDTYRNARRFLILQFWRNVGPQKMDYPLAVCDTRTVPEHKLEIRKVNNFGNSGFMGFDTYRVTPPSRPTEYDWYTYPEMNADEVLVFRGFDTDRVNAKQPFWTPHVAVKDPEIPFAKPSRRSIEVRVTCVFL